MGWPPVSHIVINRGHGRGGWGRGAEQRDGRECVDDDNMMSTGFCLLS